MPVLGVDLSNFTGPLDAQNCTQLRNSMGIDRAIIATTFLDTYASQLQVCRQAGLYCEAYLYLNNIGGTYGDGSSYADQANKVAQVVKKDVSRLWLDVEDISGTLPSAQDIINAIESVQSAGIACGIYTGAWYWPRIGNPQLGHLVPLWDARYDGDTNNFGVWYGGWAVSLVKQYQGSVQQYGLNLDLDAWRV